MNVCGACMPLIWPNGVPRLPAVAEVVSWGRVSGEPRARVSVVAPAIGMPTLLSNGKQC